MKHKVAVDAAGGDYAPEAIVEGALEAFAEHGIPSILTGDEKKLKALVGTRTGTEGIEIVHAPQTIEMDESPVDAVRTKKDSSVVVAASLVKQGQAAAVVSAGSTGAAMAASLFGLGRIKGIDRPAITTLLPTLKGVCLLMDVGANVDCRPKNLVQFAQMGSIYASEVLGVDNPRVGLLNIGEEPTKGSDAVQKAYVSLQESTVNFVGNIEGRDIPEGETDVVVCDGFVGNIVLKFAEGLSQAMFGMLKHEFTGSTTAKVGALMLRPGLMRIKKRLDYSEYGGAPLLGIRGISIIAHGSSNTKAIRNAIRVANEAAESHVIEIIAQTMGG